MFCTAMTGGPSETVAGGGGMVGACSWVRKLSAIVCLF
jgi:hypothetical protein